ncbi:hypothetical protein G9A89_013155 [Geosiphon pyriformis]|nr:hypothetical protein G9A89_013155 [Geosiphon pyriformis]
MELAIPLISPAQININNIQEKRPKTSGNICKNNFKVATTPDTTTLEFNIPDGIKVVKKSVYQYIENHINNYFFGNYNILEVRSNLYNNLVHYSQLGTENLNSKTLSTYFQELNFNIIEYCKEKYPVQFKYFFNFESKTELSNKDKQKVKQYSKTTPNTPILPKTTANTYKHLNKEPSPRNPTQQQKPILTSTNIIEYLQENESNHSENLESKETESKPEEITENKKEMATAYIAKIPEFTDEDNNTSLQEWLDKVQKAGDANETFETVMTYLGRFNKLLQQIRQLETNDYYFDAQILDQFIARLKDKLIKKVSPHVPADLATAIRHAKNYKMAIEEANHTKLVNLAIGKTSLAAKEKIDQLTKKIENYFTNQQQQQQPQKYQPPQ